MIKIFVNKPIKVSGLVSAKLFFSYNEEIINYLKTLAPAVYHKKLAMWEISSIYLSDILDTLCKYDTIDLTVEENEISGISESPLTEIEKISFKVKPYDHQVEAVNYGLAHGKWLLLDSMGLGKTAESMYLAEVLHNRGLVEHCLVICGVDSLRQNWKAEIQKFSNLPVTVLGEHITRNNTVRYETLAKRAEQLKTPIEEFFVVVNITNIRDDKFVEAFQKSANKFDMIIFDECHRCLVGGTVINTELGDMTIEEFSKLASANRPKIKSYNFKTKQVDMQQVVDIVSSIPRKDLLELSIQDDTGEIYKISCTADHKIFTKNRGWVQAQNLTDTDDIVLLAKINEQQKLIGD